MTVRRAAAVAIAVGAWCVCAPGSVSAQDAMLDEVAQMMSEARYDSARDVMELWWNERWLDAGRRDRERGLWLRGLLTVDPGMAERDFLRIVVEHRGGTYADDALLRLAHIDEAKPDYEASIRSLETLIREYSESPYRDDAQAMIARLRSLPPPETVARERSREPVPTDLPAPPDTPPPASDPTATPPDLPTVTAPEPVAYTIQLGVFSTESRAYTLVATSESLGVPVRIARLPDSEMFHVRAGAFETLAEAETFAREVQLTGLSATIFDDGALEELVFSGTPD